MIEHNFWFKVLNCISSSSLVAKEILLQKGVMVFSSDIMLYRMVYYITSSTWRQICVSDMLNVFGHTRFLIYRGRDTPLYGHKLTLDRQVVPKWSQWPPSIKMSIPLEDFLHNFWRKYKLSHCCHAYWLLSQNGQVWEILAISAILIACDSRMTHWVIDIEYH